MATCNDCRWKNEKHECPWDYMYDEQEIDYAEDCTDSTENRSEAE